ncbi:MAG: HNH endonuclease signature motif containing protein [Candidatus Desulfacyla sp.]
MSSYISEHLRQVVALRADHLCEYCLIHGQDTFFGCEVDHIISQKHGGLTESDNNDILQQHRPERFYRPIGQTGRRCKHFPVVHRP